jgi:RNA polymerase sigma factor (sigma-70 family)
VDTTERLLKVLDEHGPRLHRLLARLTLRADAAEDLLQDLFLKLRDSTGFARADDAVGFAVRAAVNLAFDWRRAKLRRPELPLTSDPAAGPSDLLARLAKRDELEQMLAALAELPDGMRLCLVLRYLEQLEAEDVARQLGKTAHQVRALCAKGIAKLRQQLNEPDREVANG